MASHHSNFRRRLIIGLIGASLVLTISSTAVGAEQLVAARDGAPAFKREVVDEHLPGAAFGVVADLVGDSTPELVVSGFGIREGSVNPSGTVVAYRRSPRARGHARPSCPNGRASCSPTRYWSTTSMATATATSSFRAGSLSALSAVTNCGSLTWWEQRPRGSGDVTRWYPRGRSGLLSPGHPARP